MKFLLFAALIVFFVPFTTQAHGGPGLSFTSTTTKGYLVDVDYSNPTFVVGQTGTFNLNFFTDGSRKTPIQVDNAWVRIVKKGVGSDASSTLFAGPVTHLSMGPTSFLYIFESPGEYAISVRYNRSEGSVLDTSLAEAEFPFTVQAAESKSFGGRGILGGILIGAIGASVVFFLLQKKSKLFT